MGDRKPLHGASVEELASVVELPDLGPIGVHQNPIGHQFVVYDVLFDLKQLVDAGIVLLVIVLFIATDEESGDAQRKGTYSHSYVVPVGNISNYCGAIRHVQPPQNTLGDPVPQAEPQATGSPIRAARLLLTNTLDEPSDVELV
jgi:hypothetical protein